MIEARENRGLAEELLPRLLTNVIGQVAVIFDFLEGALTSLKAEIIVGLRPGEADRLRAEDPSWLVNGRRGVVQTRL